MDLDEAVLLYLDGPELDGFERLTGIKRFSFVDAMIKETCWGDNSPYKGGKGSATERFLWLLMPDGPGFRALHGARPGAVCLHSQGASIPNPKDNEKRQINERSSLSSNYNA